tara:strand:- start:344 stop:484 length:141 start_codon:yes stop_codon:yes gene_type:complete
MLFARLGRTFADVPSVGSIRQQIGNPPVSPVVAEWPPNLVPISEEE